MKNLSFIVARTEDGVIGCNNALPWRLSSDLKLFKKHTSGKIVIMGRKTLESIGHPLPNRANFIISRSKDFNYPNVRTFEDINTAILAAEAEANSKGIDEIFVIGGEQIFDAMEKHVNRVYLTQIHTNKVRGDTYFNMEFPEDKWRTLRKKKYKKSEKDEYDFTFYLYSRRRRPKNNKDSIQKLGLELSSKLFA